MVDPNTLAPGEPVTITVAGATYSMRNGMLAQYELSAMRLDPSSIFFATDAERMTASLAHVLRLFRAAIAHNFTLKKQAVPTSEELALMLDGETPEKMQEISEKTLALFFPKLMALTTEMKLREAAPKDGAPALN